VRSSVAHSLGNFSSEDGIESLIKCLFDDSKDVRDGAVYSFEQMKSAKPVPLLLEIIKNTPNQQARWSAIEALGVIDSPEAVEYLLRYSLPENIRALSKISICHLVTSLPELLKHKEVAVRKGAARISGYYCKRPEILGVFSDLGEYDLDSEVRAIAK